DGLAHRSGARRAGRARSAARGRALRDLPADVVLEAPDERGLQQLGREVVHGGDARRLAALGGGRELAGDHAASSDPTATPTRSRSAARLSTRASTSVARPAA